MTRIYFIRHCEAQGNAKRIFQGSTDCDITELGAKQLEFITERFKDIKIDRAYSSPLIRAMKTAQAAVKGKNLTVEPEAGFREIDGGVLDGQKFDDVFEKAPVLEEIWFMHPQDFAPEGGEPMRDAYERIWEATCKIIKDNPDKTVVVAAHGGVIRCLLSRLHFGTVDRLTDVGWSENTAVSLIEFDENFNANIIIESDSSHLPKEFLPVRMRAMRDRIK